MKNDLRYKPFNNEKYFENRENEHEYERPMTFLEQVGLVSLILLSVALVFAGIVAVFSL